MARESAQPSCVEVQPAVDAVPAMRAAHGNFLRLVEPHRPELWRYCRHLCRAPWDAEDLLQETLARAYSKLPLLWQAIDLSSYLRRVARNCWLDAVRRRKSRIEETFTCLHALELEPDVQSDPLELRAIFEDILGSLPARQAAVLLYSVAGFSGAEIGSRLGMSPGAVRVELSRARTRLEQKDIESLVHPTPLLDRFVDAYNRRDVDALGQLLSEHVTAEIVGVAQESGRQTVLENSMLDDLRCDGKAAEVAHLLGEDLVLFTEGGEIVQMMRLISLGGQVQELRTYFFCPELLSEVGELLARPVRLNGYYFDPGGAA